MPSSRVTTKFIPQWMKNSPLGSLGVELHMASSSVTTSPSSCMSYDTICSSFIFHPSRQHCPVLPSLWTQHLRSPILFLLCLLRSSLSEQQTITPRAKWTWCWWETLYSQYTLTPLSLSSCSLFCRKSNFRHHPSPYGKITHFPTSSPNKHLFWVTLFAFSSKKQLLTPLRPHENCSCTSGIAQRSAL